MASAGGLEPPTFRVETGCSIQLNYAPSYLQTFPRNLANLCRDGRTSGILLAQAYLPTYIYISGTGKLL